MRRHTVCLLALLLISSAALGQNLKLEKSIPFSDAEAVQFTAISPKGSFLAAACKDARVRVSGFRATDPSWRLLETEARSGSGTCRREK
jgi:hypothetical protein